MDLTQSHLRDLFWYNPAGHLIWRESGKGHRADHIAGYYMTSGYHQLMVNQRHHYTHRCIWIWHNGSIPDGLQVDHIDADKRNNRIDNLQLLTPSENTAKHYAANKPSGLPLYVRQMGPNYQARYKGNHLGTFKTIDEAVAAVEAVK